MSEACCMSSWDSDLQAGKVTLFWRRKLKCADGGLVIGQLFKSSPVPFRVNCIYSSSFEAADQPYTICGFGKWETSCTSARCSFDSNHCTALCLFQIWIRMHVSWVTEKSWKQSETLMPFYIQSLIDKSDRRVLRACPMKHLKLGYDLSKQTYSRLLNRIQTVL